MADRTAATRRMVLAGLMAAGSLPLASAARAQAQPPAPAPDPNAGRYQVDTLTLATPRQPMRVTFTRLKFPGRRPVAIVLPEKSGPAPAFEAVARRLAQEGLLAVMPDLPSAWGVGAEGPQDLRDAYNKTPLGDLTAMLNLLVDQLARIPDSNGSIGILAFQWGAQVALPLLQKAGRLKAAVLFDTVMDRPERWQNVTTPMQIHIPEQDQAVFGGADNIEKKFLSQGRLYEQYFYPGMPGGFALDADSKRYNKEASDLAFDRAAKYMKKRLQF